MKGLKEYIHTYTRPEGSARMTERWHTQSAHTGGGIILYVYIQVRLLVGKGKIGRRTNAKTLARAVQRVTCTQNIGRRVPLLSLSDPHSPSLSFFFFNPVLSATHAILYYIL